MRKYYFILLSFILSSCTILLPFYGVKKKHPESLDFQKKYLSSIGIDTFNLYRLKCSYYDSLSDLKYAVNLYKVMHNSYASPVQFRFYDSTGKFITGWEQCFGNATKIGYFDTIPMQIATKFNVDYINYNLNFNQDINLFDINTNEKHKILSNIHNYDYTIVIFWAAWTGVFNKRNFQNIYEYIKKYKKKTFYILKLNTAPCDKSAKN